MSRFSLIHLKKRTLGLMWLMLGLYAWLSSFAQLSHTDDLHSALVQAAVSSAYADTGTGIAPATAARNAPALLPATARSVAHDAPAEPCAACEWVASVHTVSTPSFTLAGQPFSYALARTARFPSALLQRSIRITRLRGPPAA